MERPITLNVHFKSHQARIVNDIAVVSRNYQYNIRLYIHIAR